MATPTISLPGVSLPSGFRRRRVPLVEVERVRLAFHSEGRNGRWRLVVDMG